MLNFRQAVRNPHTLLKYSELVSVVISVHILMSYTFPSTGDKHSMQQMLADIEDEEQEEDQDSTTLEGQPTDAIVSEKDNPADGDEDVVNLTEFYTIAGLLLSLLGCDMEKH